ncbi:MAG: hypothetical protein IT291_03260 [Deltaproteobacteria bacterium]|nr:hypothetical protein [Deltaproteobacteria bacterium]
MEKSLERLRLLVAARPECPEFVELAEMLSTDAKTRPEAREVCFAGLARDPSNLKARLLLARLFYLDGMNEFCLKELLELRRRFGLLVNDRENLSLDRLIASFGDILCPHSGLSDSACVASSHFKHGNQSGGGAVSNPDNEDIKSKVVAEMDIEADFAELLDEIDE